MSASSSTPVVTGTITPSFESPFYPSPTSSVQQGTETSSPVVNNGPPGISKSSSLLFGFLVTFLVLFVAFMACGMSSRRAIDRRRRRGLAGLSGDGDGRQMEMRRPALWDVWISSGKESWQNMMPLSVKVIHREVPSASRPEDVSEAAAAAPPTTYSMASPDYFPTYIASGRGIARVAGTPAFLNAPRRSPQRQSPAATNSNQNHHQQHPRVPHTERTFVDEFIRPMQTSWALLLRKLHLRGSDAARQRNEAAATAGGGGDKGERVGEPVEALRVSVLITMPAPPRSFKSLSGIIDESDDRVFEEYALGVVDVPWDDGKDCTFG